MKNNLIYSLGLFFLLFPLISFSTPFTAYLDDIGTTTCPGSNTNFGDDLFIDLPAGISFSGFSRENIGCQSAGSHYRSSVGNTTTSKAIAIDDDIYVTWSLSANASVEFTISEMAIRHERSNQGANNAAIYYSIDGASFTQVDGDFIINSSNGRDVLSFGTPISIPADATIEFRMFAWAAGGPSGNGNFRIKGGDNYTTGSGIVGTFTPTANPALNLTENFEMFFYPLNDGPSEPQSLNVGGANLTSGIVINVPAGYEQSLSAAGPYQTTDIALTPSSGTVSSTDVFVRLAEGLPQGSYNDNITITSDDPNSPELISLSGQVIAETLPYVEDFGSLAGVFPLGWTTSGSGAANWTIGTSTTSPGSGGANLQDNGNLVGQEAVITLNRAISTIGAASVSVTFLARKTSAYSGEAFLDYSINGVDWINVPFADVANDANWGNVSVQLPSAAADVNNLRLRLRTTRSNTSGNYRIDDFTVFAPSVYTYIAGDVHTETSWEDNGGFNPPNFTNDNQIFQIVGTSSPSTTAPFEISGDNSILFLGNGTDVATFTITDDNPYTGSISVRDNSTLFLQSTTIPDLTGLSDESTVSYEMDGAADIVATAYGNLWVSNSGTKTFPNSILAVNGDLIVENTTIAFAGTNARIDYSKHISLLGTVDYAGGLRPSLRVTANDNNQSITTGANVLEVFNFEAQNKTSGELLLSPSNATIEAINNLRLDFTTGVSFNDGGNIITYGDDLRFEGDESSYNLTGTIRLDATSGTNDIENYDDIPFNNFELISASTATTNLPDFNLIVNGNFLLDGEFTFEGSDASLELGGDITLQNTVLYDGVWRPNVQLFGSNNQTITTGSNIFEAYNFYATKTDGNVLLSNNDANIKALNNLRLNFSGTSFFDDGANTIVFGDDLEIEGSEINFNFEGTLRLEGLSGDNDFDIVDVPINNLEIELSGDGRSRMNRSTAPLIVINGDFTYFAEPSNSNMPVGSSEVRIGGNFIDNSTEDKINEQNSTFTFFGTNDASITTPTDFNNLTIDKTIASVTLNNSLLVSNDLNVQNGTLNIPTDLSITVENELINNADIVVESEGALVQTTGSSLSGSGTFFVERTLGVSNPWFMGSPINNQDIFNFGINPIQVVGGDGVQFDPQGSCDPSDIDVPGEFVMQLNEDANIIDDCSNSLWHYRSTGNLTNARGYAVYTTSGNTLVFQGTANNGTVTYSGLTRQSGDVTLPNGSDISRGWHLVSNPYPSPITLTGADLLALGFDAQIHRWDAGSWVSSNPLSSVTIAVGQGFQIRKTDVGGTTDFTLDNSFRTTDAATFYKDNSGLGQHLSITLANTEYENTGYVYFRDDATPNFDPELDVNRLFGLDHIPLVYTKSDDNEKLAYNALPLLEAEVHTTVPLAVYEGSAGEFTLTFEELNSLETDLLNVTVILEDLKLDEMTQLTEGFEYDFTVEAEDARDRFVLHFYPTAKELEEEEEILSINDLQNQIVGLFPNPTDSRATLVLDANHTYTDVQIISITGKVINTFYIADGQSNVNIDLTNMSAGVYLVQVKGLQAQTVRKLIKK